MPIDALVEPLLRVPLFQGLRPLQITEIARQAERIIFKPGETIARSGASAEAAYLIVAGTAERIYGSGRSGADTLEPGSLISEMAMLISVEHGATVVARSAVRCLKLNRADLHAQMENDPALADHFTDCITHRLTKVAAELQQIQQVLAADAARTEETLGAFGPLQSGSVELTALR
jgi:CRP-like cAMP-binding protein